MVQKIYLAKYGGTRTSRTKYVFAAYEDKFKEILEGLPPYEESIPGEIEIKAEADLAQDIPEKRKTGTGYHGGNIPCSKSVLGDISRLEILIGGKQVGNNSPEIINEAAEICQRLFQGRVMDIGMYRSFIDEQTDDYYID